MEQVDFSQAPKAFKNPSYKAPHRRPKPTKAVLSDEQRRLAALEGQAVMNKATYFSVDAPPSLKPRKWWCDITGLEGRYKSTGLGLRYYNKEVYEVIKHLGSGTEQQYLALRNANVVLR